jgi:hypothetical protein
MKDSSAGTEPKKEYVRCSVVTPTGCLIRCVCGNVFSPAELPRDETCPECGRVYQPGFTYDIEVVSRRSGMSLGIVHGESAGDDLTKLADRAVEERYGPDCREFCSWHVDNLSNAYFGAEREES